MAAGWTRLTAGLPTSLATRLRRRRLEAFKFSVYLFLPVGASYYFGSGAYPYLERIIQQRSYVVYPPEGPAPPAPDEMARLVDRERAREEARTAAAATAAAAAAAAATGEARGGRGGVATPAAATSAAPPVLAGMSTTAVVPPVTGGQAPS